MPQVPNLVLVQAPPKKDKRRKSKSRSKSFRGRSFSKGKKHPKNVKNVKNVKKGGKKVKVSVGQMQNYGNVSVGGNVGKIVNVFVGKPKRPHRPHRPHGPHGPHGPHKPHHGHHGHGSRSPSRG